ncbi:hypothetical protein A8L45_02980 [Veronia pacifica]|uniref:Uncharacterized protein n=1 Tax=Veronia pacifica TaxID=1080227 RepID=A0A1C3EQT0_9GAMM|nr:hypothetical protein A8L45_02980 [Veronia pacifica]
MSIKNVISICNKINYSDIPVKPDNNDKTDCHIADNLRNKTGARVSDVTHMNNLENFKCKMGRSKLRLTQDQVNAVTECIR